MQGWTMENDILQLRGARPSQATIEVALKTYEEQGCSCGKGLDCPLMKYLLTSPSELDSGIDTGFDNVDEYDESNPELDSDDDYSEFEENQDVDVDMNHYDFTDEGSYVENPMTNFDEEDLVNDVFRPSSQIYADEEDTKYKTGAGHLIDEVEEKTHQVASYTETALRLQQENRLLREKLQEIELQVNQQLREISSRQQEQGAVEDRMSNLTKANKELTWANMTCLKMLKFLPDASKMSFRNSRDFNRMLQIYKEHVEPQKEATR